MSHGTRLEARYQDGWVLREQPEDMSIFMAGGNTFTDILRALPELIHGPMVELALHVDSTGQTLTVDWSAMPDDAVPVCERRMEMSMIVGAQAEGDHVRCTRMWFGYRRHTADGQVLEEEIQQVDFDPA